MNTLNMNRRDSDWIIKDNIVIFNFFTLGYHDHFQILFFF